jgi:hypothetical protein
LLRDFNAKVGSEDVFKPKRGNDSLRDIRNNNGVNAGNFSTLKIQTVKRIMFPHRKVHKYTLTSDGKTQNQTDSMLINKRTHSSIAEVRSIRGADCDTGYCLVVANVRHRLSVSKGVEQKFDMDRFNLKKLNGVEGSLQSQICFQLWKTWNLMKWTSIRLGKVSDKM